MSNRASAQGDDLAKVLRTVLGDLVDEDVRVQLTLPTGVEISNVNVAIEASVTSRPHLEEPTARTDEESDSEDVAGSPPEGELPSLDEESEAAADFIEGLLDALDLPGHLRIRILDDEDQAEVEIVDVGGGALIGRRGQTLEAIQELLRSAMQREFQQRSRVRVDVEGYRARRLEKLLEKAEDAIEDALETGEAQRLEPMDVFERKAVHRLVSLRDGVASRSQGREPGRRVVIEVE
jgi:spoIIIJ-associated protein